jgi:uncharacterized membrane protein
MLNMIFAQAPEFDTIEDAYGPTSYKLSSFKLTDFFDLGITQLIFFVAGAALLIYLLTAGISMMTSRGDPKALEGAKARLTYALGGFLIVFIAYWIVQIIGLVLGLEGFGGIF